MKNLPKSEEVPDTSGWSRAKSFLMEMKKSLSQVNFTQVMVALQKYKTTDDIQALLEATTFVSEDRSTRGLLQGGWPALQP